MQVQRRQRRVAEALEDDVAAPDRALLLALAEDCGVEPVRGPEDVQRGVRDGELLVRRRDQRAREVVREHCPSAREIDRERP
jgi:hypothetical protein